MHVRGELSPVSPFRMLFGPRPVGRHESRQVLGCEIFDPQVGTRLPLAALPVRFEIHVVALALFLASLLPLTS